MAKWLLDPGHGGTDPGATYKSRKESDDVLRLSLRVGEILKANNENVYYTRSTDTTVSLSERSSKENTGNYDYFISIHRNANKPETAKGVETYIYAKGRISEVLASKVNNELVKVGFIDRGIKVSNFHVLRNTKCPAILIEVGFIDSSIDNSIFDSNFEEIAKAIAKGCLLQLGKSINTSDKSENSNNNSKSNSENEQVYYRCIVGSFKERNNAEARKAELISKGYKDTFIDVYKKS